MIKAALLDMDGTIFDTERLSTEGWLHASSKLMDTLMTIEQINAFHGRNYDDNKKAFIGWYGDGDLYDRLRMIRAEYIKKKIADEGVPVKPGLYKLLDTFKEKGIRICIATGTARSIAAPYWDETGVTPYLCASICGDEVEHSKPNPDIFLKAAAKCGVEPEECIIFEDSPNGLRAAHASGAMVVLIPDTDPLTEEMLSLSDEVYHTLADAADAIASWPAVQN